MEISSLQRVKRKSSDASSEKHPLLTPPMPTFSSTPPWEGDITGFQAMTARRRLLRRTSSFSGSSVTSNSSLDNDLACDVPWTSEELVKVDAALAQITEQAACLDTPFVGPPPSQLTHNVARHLCRSKTWKHSLKSTRAKILEAAKETKQWKMDVDDTPLPRDMEETPRRSKRLARQNSSSVMTAPRNGMTLARLSHKLQKSDSSDSEAFSRVAVARHHTLNVLDPAEAYPTPPRSQRLKRATSMSLRDGAAPALERSSSANAASSSLGPDLSLFGAAYSPPVAGLSTPFEPAFAYGLRPKRVPLLRKLSGLHLHSSPSSAVEDDERADLDSPLSSSPTSSMLRYSVSSSQTSSSVHDYFSQGWSYSDAIAGRSIRRSNSSFGPLDRLGLA